MNVPKGVREKMYNISIKSKIKQGRQNCVATFVLLIIFVMVSESGHSNV